MHKPRIQGLARWACGVCAAVAMAGNAAASGWVLPPLPAIAPLQPSTALHSHSSGIIHFPSSTPYDLDVLLFQPAKAAPTTGQGQLYLPRSASALRSAPAMVILPSAMRALPDGVQEAVRLLNQQGIAALVVDYFTPRGVTPEMPYEQKLLAASEFDVLADAYAALKALQSHPAIDAQRIGVMGYARGGMVARMAMDQRVHEALAPGQPPFAVHVDFYGPCYADIPMKHTTGKPLMAFRAAGDASSDLSACATIEEQLRRAGSPVSAVVYDRAPHAWDSGQPQSLQGRPYVSGCTIRFNEQGEPTLHGQALISASAAPDRATRQRLRAQAGRQLGSCIKYGVLTGQDDKTQAQASRKLLQFLRSRL